MNAVKLKEFEVWNAFDDAPANIQNINDAYIDPILTSDGK